MILDALDDLNWLAVAAATAAAGQGGVYVPPGHTPVHHAGAEIVEFTPTEILGQTIPVVMKNLEAARAVVGKVS